MKLSELRKELKAIGFKVKVTTFSFGRHATYQSLDGRDQPSIYFGEEHRQEWIKLIEYQSMNLARLKVLKEDEKISGLLKSI